MKIRGIDRGGRSSPGSMGLVPGQKVRGRVIARLGTGFFRVGAGGHIFNAQTDLPLHVGQRLTARVEYGDTKVFLKIIPDAEQRNQNWAENISEAEVQRILTGLGFPPEKMEIIEFIERLDRYRKYEKHPTLKPSAIWCMAIAWVRGIKGGGEMFALMSYTLRQWTLRKQKQLPPLQRIIKDLLLGNEGELQIESERQTRENDIFYERRREAFDLLNEKPQAYGELILGDDSEDTSSGLFLDSPAKRLLRWSDNPSQPVLVLETSLSQGRLQARINILSSFQKNDKIQLDRWETELREMIAASDLQIKELIYNTVNTHEALRFMFWRRWDEATLFDLSA